MHAADFIAFDVETATSDPSSLCQIGYMRAQRCMEAGQPGSGGTGILENWEEKKMRNRQEGNLYL
jgi:hypothetical protein